MKEEIEALSQEIFSIFILKSQPTVLVQAESFLRNRKWVVGSSIRLKEALAYIIQKQPQYVFLSVDHPHKKVRILPKLLAQAFPCKVIAFAERGGQLSMSVMNEMGLDYNLYPPVSGPAIQRLVLKIRKDEELRTKGLGSDGKPLGSAEAKSEAPDMMTFKAEGQNSGEFAFDARSALSQLLASETGENSAEAMAAAAGVAYTGNMGQQGPGSGVGAGGIGYAGGPGTSGADPATATPEQQPGESFEDWAERMRKAAMAQASAGGENSETPGNGFGDGSADSSNPETRDGNYNNRGGKNSPIMESDYARREKKRGYRIESDPRYRKNDGNESIIVRGTQQAIDDTVDLRGDPADEIAKATNVACILIQGPRFSGYLVCAMGHDRKVDNRLIGSIQEKLISFLKANGEELKDDEVIDMKIQEVDFQDWALEQADFLRKSVHDGDEIAMAFFPTGNLEARLEESASRKMLQMKLDELRDDTPLEFDLYIYMPENNKYLLYTPEGMPIYGQQKSRLRERGVTHMHLKKEAVQGVKKYRAQNFLNEKIAAYKAKAARKIKDSDTGDS